MPAKRPVLGLVSLALPGSLLSVGVLLSFGYASQLVYTIGDTRQLEPLFLGIVAGSVIFSLVGYLTKPTLTVLSLETLDASLLLAASYAVMVMNSLVLGGGPVLVISFAMTSVLSPVGTLLRLNRQGYSASARVAFGLAQALLTIFFVFVYSFYYVTSGQTDFFAGPVILLTLSLISSVMLLRAK